MAEIRVSSTKMREMAGEFKNEQHELYNVLNKGNILFSELESIWDDPDTNEMVKRYKQLMTEARQMLTLYEMAYQKLNHATNSMNALDQKVLNELNELKFN